MGGMFTRPAGTGKRDYVRLCKNPGGVVDGRVRSSFFVR